MRYSFPSVRGTKYEIKIVGLWKILEASSFPSLNDIYSKNPFNTNLLMLDVLFKVFQRYFFFQYANIIMRSYLFLLYNI